MATARTSENGEMTNMVGEFVNSMTGEGVPAVKSVKTGKGSNTKDDQGKGKGDITDEMERENIRRLRV